VALHGGDRLEAFLSWADAGADGVDAQLMLFQDGGRPPITAIWYRDRPSRGWGVGLTYGASLLTDPPIELMIVVHSREPAWAWALADFIDRHRAQVNDLGLGDTINWHERVARRSRMDAFFIGAPVGAPDDGIVHLSDDEHVQLLQAFPIYASERALARDIGERAFAERVGDDLLEPRRDPVQ
jgi:hypothetical protein